MEILGYVGALFIGLVLGLTGGGGSILTVPILVYLMNISPVTATAYSLFIVGTTSTFGAIQNYRKNLVDIILTNNGYRTVNIGIKQTINQIIDAAQKRTLTGTGRPNYYDYFSFSDFQVNSLQNLQSAKTFM